MIRRRAYELAALKALGASHALLVRSGRRELLALVGAGVMLGLVSGLVAASAALPALLDVSGADAPPAWFGPAWLPVLALAAAVLGLLALIADVSARSTARRATARPPEAGAGMTADPPSRSARASSVRCEELVHIYRTGELDVVAVRGVDLTSSPASGWPCSARPVRASRPCWGCSVGSSRRRLARCGSATSPLGGLSERALLRMRAQRVGFVLQGAARNLLPYGTPVDNIRFAHRSVPRGRRRDLLDPLELLDASGSAAVADRPIPLLAGGEQQRVALAVAVANGPGLLLADEPTSQLDHDGREAVLGLLDVVNERFGTTIVVVTHDAEVGAHLGRAVSMRYGRIGLEEAGRRGLRRHRPRRQRPPAGRAPRRLAARARRSSSSGTGDERATDGEGAPNDDRAAGGRRRRAAHRRARATPAGSESSAPGRG